MNHFVRSVVSGVGIVLVAALAMAPSCPSHLVGTPEADGASVRPGKHTVDGVPTQTVDIVPDPGAPASAHLFLPSTANLTPPWSVQVTMGFADPAEVASFTGYAGLECRAIGSSPLDFHGIYVHATPGGLRVSAKVAIGGGLLQAGSVTFAGANWLDLLILNNGSGVYFQARRTGDADFTLVLGQPAPAGVYAPGIAAYDIGGGPPVSFYDPVLSETSDPAGGSAYETLADAIFRDVCFPLESAGSLVAGPRPDVPSAASILDGLASGLPSLLPLVTSLPTATQQEQDFASSLQRSLSKFTKELLKAQKTADKGKSPLKSIAKARLLADALIGALRQQ